MTGPEEPGPGRFPMQVEANVFLGDRWEYRLTRGGLRMVAHGPAPSEGAEAWCELPPRHVWIFTRDGAADGTTAAPAATAVSAAA